ncbi:MAG: class I SAM-dependent methyltransferase, partial [Chitinophagaceae bacterium]|nr:class I SAM-dependent methyltransferase [Chitinophagaceae bacterium]
MNEFIDPQLSVDNIDRFVVRSRIFSALKTSLHEFKGELLDVGCGKMPYRKYIFDNSKIKKYIGLDIETAIDYKGDKPDFFWDGKKMPFQNDSFDTILLTEVLEHCPDPDIVLKECFRVLKNDGVLFFTVPFLWPLHEAPHDEYRYTPWALQRHFQNAGFVNIGINPLGGWHFSLAQILGLWGARAPISDFKRKFFRRAVLFIMKRLIKM